MTGWIILAVIAALIGALMWLPVRVCVTYRDQPGVVLRIGFIPIRILPAKEKTPEQIQQEERAKLRKSAEKALAKKKAKEEAKKAKLEAKRAKKEGRNVPQQPEEEKPPSIFKRLKDMYGLKGLVQLFKEIVMIAMRMVGGVLGGLVLEKLHLKVCVATGDAAQTAYQYGQFCAEIYPASEVLCRLMRCKNRQVDITYDFLGQKTQIDCNLIIRLRVGTVFNQLFKMIGRFIKLLFTQKKFRRNGSVGTNTERKNNKCLNSIPKA